MPFLGDLSNLKRALDLSLSSFLLAIFSLPILLTALLVRLTSPGPVLYWSIRIGKDNQVYRMPKFRSMVIGTQAVASHLLEDPKLYLTPIGSYLRKSSIDELPQLWCVFTGKMSLVGPRPALYNQDDLIALRKQAGVDSLVPGITGWAQVNGRDELSIHAKVKLDIEYLHKQSFWFDLKILCLTILKVLKRAGITH
jgi:O-antigen biosynthesis protein WbqP